MSVDDRLHRFGAELARVGCNLTVSAPGLRELEVGDRPTTTRVRFHSEEALRPLLRGDHLALAEAYLEGRIDIEGEFVEVLKVTELLEMDPSRLVKAALRLRFHLPGRRRFQRAGIAFHYDRPAEFFLGWLDRWRSYSHGIYCSPDDGVTDAQARKLQWAMDALDLRPGMTAFDMGCGWGCFLEYAGERGIRVHGITISAEQYRFVKRLIDDRGLPCTVELVDFLDYDPATDFDAAVFMGTLEHMPTYARVTDFLTRHLKPEGRLWADFCAQRTSFMGGEFMRKHIWPGPATYVNVHGLVKQLVTSGFNVHELRDDTRSYARTVYAWVRVLETLHGELGQRWGEAPVRAFLLFLWGSYYFLSTNRTQAYHLVAGRAAAPLPRTPSATA